MKKKWFIGACLIAATLAASLFSWPQVKAQTKPDDQFLGSFRIGERIAYSISAGIVRDAGVAELAVVSRGKYADRDAVELTASIKTRQTASAAFGLIDETRTTFANPVSGEPYFTKRTILTGIDPVVETTDYATAAAPGFDFLTFFYKLRETSGVGSLQLVDRGQSSPVLATAAGTKLIRTDLGELSVRQYRLESEVFGQYGMSRVLVGISDDDRHLPVFLTFRTPRGQVRFSVQSYQAALPVVTPSPTPSPSSSPVVTRTPVPQPTIKPTPKPPPANLPLSAELPFGLGETLSYRLTNGGKPAGAFVLQVRERKQVAALDSVFLTATATEADPGGLFAVGDSLVAQVDPEALTPHQFDVSLRGGLSWLNQSIRIDQQRGVVLLPNASVQIPVNTHNFLSLLYAIRAFNLRPSRDIENPVNDTRVAVLYDNRFYVFTLRPRVSELITTGNGKVSAQLINIVTGNAALDALQPKIWLSDDETRVPLRIVLGTYQADLTGRTIMAVPVK